jgi:thiosulfate/3-mercaptopyruvate sulfurtransferase
VLQALGYSEVKNYDGSWIEWANNQALPIVNGAEQSQPEEIAFLRN